VIYSAFKKKKNLPTAPKCIVAVAYGTRLHVIAQRGTVMRDKFIGAIRSRNKIRLTFHSKEDGRPLVRVCAPMDYGPSSRAHDKSDRFHSWDYDSDTVRHTLSLLSDQVISIEVLSDTFDPAEFVSWTPKWIVERDWGAYS
jgi:hypothetical protein